mmetsp:Transcript_3572/g.7839  ORF Transcript_3572/g.7839 Transcript_3572/m.7839 type:complete len:327 (-) Transcript_3572:34-1014(-)
MVHLQTSLAPRRTSHLGSFTLEASTFTSMAIQPRTSLFTSDTGTAASSPRRSIVKSSVVFPAPPERTRAASLMPTVPISSTHSPSSGMSSVACTRQHTSPRTYIETCRAPAPGRDILGMLSSCVAFGGPSPGSNFRTSPPAGLTCWMMRSALSSDSFAPKSHASASSSEAPFKCTLTGFSPPKLTPRESTSDHSDSVVGSRMRLDQRLYQRWSLCLLLSLCAVFVSSEFGVSPACGSTSRSMSTSESAIGDGGDPVSTVGLLPRLVEAPEIHRRREPSQHAVEGEMWHIKAKTAATNRVFLHPFRAQRLRTVTAGPMPDGSCNSLP